MYQILCDGNPILDTRSEKYMVVNPKAKVEVNTVGEGSFTIYKNHPFYKDMKMLKSIFEISDDFGVVFRGRMTENTLDFDNGKAVDLEGLMAFFNDSMVGAFSFPEDFLNDDDYVSASTDGNVIAFFLNWLIENHNGQTQPHQHFKLGNVTVTDPNNFLSRSSTEISTTWDTLKSKLFESALGGFLCIRYEEDGNYIDYLSEFELTNTQEIDFGKNLLDLKHESDANETYTAIIPIGAEVESEVAAVDDESGSTEKKRLTLESVEDGAVTEDIFKITLPNGLHALYSKSAVEEYGWICAPVKDTTWEDVTEVQNLLTKSVAYLTNTAVMLSDTVEFTAADLNFTNKEIQSFRIYRNIRATSVPHGLSDTYQLTRLDLDLLNPQNTKITVGKTKLTLTDQNGKEQTNTIIRIESVEKDVEETKSSVIEAKQQVIEQNTSFINTCEQIVMSAMTAYTETDSFESFKEAMEAQLELLSNQMTLQFTEATQKIENVNGDLQEKFNTITKYFTFDIDGLTIGSVDNPNKVVIDNDEISILVNGLVVQKFDAEGKALIPELEVPRSANLLGLLISETENTVDIEYVGVNSYGNQ